MYIPKCPTAKGSHSFEIEVMNSEWASGPRKQSVNNFL